MMLTTFSATTVRFPQIPVAADIDLETIYINGGKRGFLIAIQPPELTRVLPVVPVAVGISASSRA